jgi:Leucine-rich repeat (LRR) protein
MKKSHLNFYLATLLLLLSCSFLQGQVNSETDENREKVYSSLKEAVLNAGKVYQLDLSSGDLVEFPKEIFKLKNLEYLNLASNQLSTIPAQKKNCAT